MGVTLPFQLSLLRDQERSAREKKLVKIAAFSLLPGSKGEGSGRERKKEKERKEKGVWDNIFNPSFTGKQGGGRGEKKGGGGEDRWYANSLARPGRRGGGGGRKKGEGRKAFVPSSGETEM